jgi:16S rRNA (uracil1498-N3)-methyltransferase
VSAPVFVHPGIGAAHAGDVVTLEGAEARHAGTVQRRGVGEVIELIDGRGVRAQGEIVEVRTGSLDVRIGAMSSDDDPTVVLVQALAKAGRDEQAVESATELGVTKVIPWAADRSIVQWKGAKVDKGRAGWISLVTAAAKQSRRARIPEVGMLVNTSRLTSLVEGAIKGGARVLLLHEVASVPLSGLEWTDTRQPVWLIVGPEGGIADAEVAALTDAGALAVVLGPQVLRASSAGPAAIAALAALRGTWHPHA